MCTAPHWQRHWKEASVTSLGRLCPRRYRDGTTPASGFAIRPWANTGSGVRSVVTGTDRRRSAIQWIARSLKPSVSPASMRSHLFSPRRTRASPATQELDSRVPHRRGLASVVSLKILYRQSSGIAAPLDTPLEKRGYSGRTGYAYGGECRRTNPCKPLLYW